MKTKNTIIKFTILAFFLLIDLLFNYQVFISSLEEKDSFQKKQINSIEFELNKAILENTILLERELSSLKLIRETIKSDSVLMKAEVQKILTSAKTMLNAEIVYLANEAGKVIVRSKDKNENIESKFLLNGDELLTVVEKDKKISLALDKESKKSGIYFLTLLPESNEMNKSISGMFVIKLSLHTFENLLKTIDYPVFLTDKNQTIISSNSEISSQDTGNTLLNKGKYTSYKISSANINWKLYVDYKKGFELFTIKEKVMFTTLFLIPIITCILAIYLYRLMVTKKHYESEHDKFFNIVEQAPLSIIITDKNGDIQYTNSHTEKATYYTKEELLGRNPRILKGHKQSDEFYAKLWETITDNKTWKGEFHNKRKNGEYYWEHSIIFPFNDKKGNIENYIAFKEDITKEKELEYLATVDEMTQTLNKRTGLEFLRKRLAKKNNSTDLTNCSLVYIDINNLKLVNDQFGHQAGDELIVNTVNIIKNEIRDSDLIVRLGGDEFLVIFPKTIEKHAQESINRIISHLNKVNKKKIYNYKMSISYGIAEHVAGSDIDIDKLIDEADKKMYEMKKKNKQT